MGRFYTGDQEYSISSYLKGEQLLRRRTLDLSIAPTNPGKTKQF